MRRSAFTLLEVMVAIALTLLIASLVFAVTASAVRETAVREAVGQTSAAMGLARAEAQRRGRVVEVLARPADGAPDQWELATLVWDQAQVAGQANPREVAQPDKVQVDAIELPRGIRVRVAQPPETADGESTAEGREAVEPGVDPALVLAVFLPDGSGSMLERELVGAEGPPVRLVMNRWTGEVSSVVATVSPSKPSKPENTP